MIEGWPTKGNSRVPGEEGQALSEYAMILVLVAVACVVGVALLGTTARGFYTGFNGSF